MHLYSNLGQNYQPKNNNLLIVEIYVHFIRVFKFKYYVIYMYEPIWKIIGYSVN
jgi:hypothetical protein